MSNQPSPWGNFQIRQNPYTSPQQQRQDPVDPAAYRAMWLGIGSIPLACCPLAGAVMGVFAGMYGWNAAQSDNPTNKTLGIVGMVTGGIGLVLSVINIILGIVLRISGAFE